MLAEQQYGSVLFCLISIMSWILISKPDFWATSPNTAFSLLHPSVRQSQVAWLENTISCLRAPVPFWATSLSACSCFPKGCISRVSFDYCKRKLTSHKSWLLALSQVPHLSVSVVRVLVAALNYLWVSWCIFNVIFIFFRFHLLARKLEMYNKLLRTQNLWFIVELFLIEMF